VIRMRARIQDGGYRVDPSLVAGAIIEHVRGHAA
jgi:anti-sigma28 factor (negative regulator of flagellin synthesis)